MKAASKEKGTWYYEKEGKRKGPVTEMRLANMIGSGKLTHGHKIWREGLESWTQIEATELKKYLGLPPIDAHLVSDKAMWILLFTPIFGSILTLSMDISDSHSVLIFIALNSIVCLYDNYLLDRAGYSSPTGWVLLVPVYIYKRSKLLKRNQFFLVAWILFAAFSDLLAVGIAEAWIAETWNY